MQKLREGSPEKVMDNLEGGKEIRVCCVTCWVERVIYYAEKITSKSQYFKSILSLKQYFPLCADNFKTVYRAGIRKIILCRSNVQSRHLSSQA